LLLNGIGFKERRLNDLDGSIKALEIDIWTFKPLAEGRVKNMQRTVPWQMIVLIAGQMNSR
jgi:hypothetical protein